MRNKIPWKSKQTTARMSPYTGSWIAVNKYREMDVLTKRLASIVRQMKRKNKTIPRHGIYWVTPEHGTNKPSRPYVYGMRK